MHFIQSKLFFYFGVILMQLWVAAATAQENTPEARQFTFAWPYSTASTMAPRGGTSSGPNVVLAEGASEAWQSLSEPGISKKEQDRRAILAMSGGYRASFDFLEVVGFVEDYTPPAPYQSWGTEYVYVVADAPDFISLQHIIVMFFEVEGGEIFGPVVVKHWRQDWQYEDQSIHVYVGDNRWQEKRFNGNEVAGTWSQSVFQVDDSPRYQAIGQWVHEGNVSSWLSDNTWRPLPRREFSVRDDYQVLVGTNRHSITPTGWIHEEENLKGILDGVDSLSQDLPYLAKELGFNRYELITDFDFSGGDSYWENTGDFWSEVREAWNRVFTERSTFALRDRVEDKPLFEWMFEYATFLDEGAVYDAQEARRFIDSTLDAFLLE